MGFAFWRRNKTAADAAPTVPDMADDADERPDPAAAARVKARRRLIGAAALLLAVVVVAPLVLDSEPKPVPDNIPIDIPSEKTRFNPKLALPPVPAPDSAPLTPPPDQSPAEAKAEAAKAETRKAAEKPVAAKSAEKPAEKAIEKPTEKPAEKSAAKAGRFTVQVAASANESSARELADKLKKGGVTAYVEKVEIKDGARWRVRAGPYASRDDAEAARAKLGLMGVKSSNVIAL